MLKKYSVVFYPSPEVLNAVKKMKGDLKVKIDWYNSCNSDAHITIFELSIDESQIDFVKQKLLKICNTFTPFPVNLNSFNSFPNVGAFYIAPSENSEKELQLIMAKIHNAMKGFKIEKITKPHMSIGRRLTPENLKIASDLFTKVNLNFLCDSIVLREFDPEKRQFFIIDTFKFGSNPEPELVQGSLF